MKTINILWTGGWDSTFRILQLSTKNLTIQPYYLKDNRPCEHLELDTVKNITEDIRSRKETKCVLNNVIAIDVPSLAVDETITASYNKLTADFNRDTNLDLGTQYEWLARFAKSVETLDLSIEKGTKPIAAIKRYGALEKVYDIEIGAYYKIDKSNSPQHIIDVFGQYRYPLVEYSKLDMKKEAEENGFIQIMNKTWFCHRPINNKPCGACNPCIATLEEGFEYRFSSESIERYKMLKRNMPHKNKNSLLQRVARKVSRIFGG